MRQAELRIGELELDLAWRALRIVDAEAGALVEQVLAHVDGGRLARIAGVLLEGEAEHGEALAVERVEEALDDAVGEALLLIVVDAQHLQPVVGALGELERLAHIDQVVDVLLEAAAAEAHARLQELGANARVGAYGLRHLLDVGAARLANGRYRVDARYALGEKGVRRQLGQLGRPRVRGEYERTLDPVGVHVAELLDGPAALARRALAADEDAIGREQVAHRRALGQELRIGEDLKAHRTTTTTTIC